MIQIIGNRLSQWDVGRLVGVTGEASHVHFANQGDSKAVIIDIEEGEAKIPDYLLQTGKTLLAYAVKDGVTLESYTFAVRNRERPENYVYEEDLRNYIYELIRDAESAIARAGQTADEADIAADEAREACYEAKEAAKNANAAADNANKAATNAVHQATVEYMNIRVDLNTSITDGTEVVFRSPVDCSQVTGLKVYYPGASHEFAFADAHGNNVGDIDHLFAENVVVKVILDVTTSMAFVQNADTNAYLEGRFAEAVTHTPQVLPDKKKAQARENIDAAHIDDSKVAEDETWSSQKIRDTINGKTLLVTYDEQGERTSHNAADIYDHVATGGAVVLLYQNDYFTLARATESYAEFSYYRETDDAVYNIRITSDGTLLYGKELVTGETLEAAQKGIIDKLCPSFTESGSVVTCQPVEGYPLSVVSQIQPVQEGSGDPAPASWETHTTITGNGQVDLEVTEEMEGCTFRVYDSVSNQPPTVYNPGYTSDVGTVNGKYTEFSIPTNSGWTGMSVFIVPYDESESETVFVVEKRNSGNIRPITGHSEVHLYRGGKNLIDYTKAIGRYNKNAQPSQTVNIIPNGIEWVSGDYYFQIPCNIKKGATVIFSCVDEANAFNSFYLADSKTEKFCSKGGIIANSTAITATADADAIFIYKNNPGEDIVEPLRLTHIQLEYGTTVTPYEPYRGETFTIDLGQTVYGGSYNWQTGELVIDSAVYTVSPEEILLIANDGENYIAYFTNKDIAETDNGVRGYGLCNRLRNYNVAKETTYTNIFSYHAGGIVRFRIAGVTDLDSVKAWVVENPLQFWYKKVEPITVRLSPREILALSGENTLYSDTGDTTVKGKADPSAIIEKLTNAILALGGNV